MGKSSKKSAKVDAAPAVVEPTKSARKPGKRGAVEAIENLASAKKHKKDVLVEQKVETKFQKNVISKKEETETSEDTSSESEEEQKKALVKAAVASKKQPVAASKNGNVPATKGKPPSSSSEDDTSDESESEEEEVKLAPKKAGIPAKPPVDDEESSEEESSSDEDVRAMMPSKKQPVAASKNGSVTATKGMDKTWMLLSNRFCQAYVDGVDSFIEFAKAHLGEEVEIKCPCTNCCNYYKQNYDTVKSHLLIRGMRASYTTWFSHGETFLT